MNAPANGPMMIPSGPKNTPIIVPMKHPLLMQCRHCIRYSLGFCVKRGGRKPEWKEPLSLVLGDGRKFRLEFDCRQCQMNVYGE